MDPNTAKFLEEKKTLNALQILVMGGDRARDDLAKRVITLPPEAQAILEGPLTELGMVFKGLGELVDTEEEE